MGVHKRMIARYLASVWKIVAYSYKINIDNKKYEDVALSRQLLGLPAQLLALLHHPTMD